MRTSLVLLSSGSLALALLLTARDAHAGCEVECTSIESRGFTLIPALPCLEQVEEPDDNSCVCASTITLLNRCTVPLRVTYRGSEDECTNSSACDPRRIGANDTFTVEARVPVREEGEASTETVDAQYEVQIAEGDAAGDYTLTVSATAEIDPSATACSVSQVGAAGNGVACAFGLGLVAAAVARRRRSTTA